MKFCGATCVQTLGAINRPVIDALATTHHADRGGSPRIHLNRPGQTMRGLDGLAKLAGMIGTAA